jgi:hypothetical protein
MQGILYNLLSDEQPIFLQHDTDTAHPRSPIPIYYIHGGSTPFCNNPLCFCQRGKRAGAFLYQKIAKGKLRLAQLAATESGSSTTTTPQITRIHVDLVADIPEECQLYGHSWQITENRDVYECSLCHARGYCPVCTPLAPDGAQPFSCSAHAGHMGRKEP